MAKWLLLAVAAMLIAWQLTYLGVADDNDFPKLIGPYCLGPADPSHYKLFEYVSFSYRYDARYCWHAGIPTSAHLPLAIARLSVGRPGFDLRSLGAVYGGLFLLAFWLLLRQLRSPWTAGLAVIAVFCTATYVPQFNSLYLDTASYSFLLLSLVLAGGIAARRRAGPAEFAALTVCLCLLAWSKGQHALLPVVLLPALWLSGRRAWSAVAAVLVVLSAGAELRLTPRWYSSVAAYNALFYRALPLSGSPQQDLAELGLSDMAAQVGMNAYSPGSPMDKFEYIQGFAARMSQGRLGLYYVTHPGVTIRAFEELLREGSWIRVRMIVGQRLYRLGNFTKDSGRPPEAQSRFLDAWTAAKVTLFGGRPWIYFSYIVVLLTAYAVTVWRAGLTGWMWLIPMVLLEFAVAMGDGVDHGRHLLIGNALLDVAAVALLGLIGNQHLHQPRNHLK